MFHYFYVTFFKPIAFRFDPELVHDKMSQFGHFLGRFKLGRWITKLLFSSTQNEILKQEIQGVVFKNPVGLSAGFDKNAKLMNILPYIDFGFEEIGSVTMYPYAGNPKPRLYRLKKSKALVVYYGLMNDGVKTIGKRIKKALKTDMVLGVSIAKTNSDKTAKEEDGIMDYYHCLKYLVNHNIGQYYTINISCPNTFGGEPFTTVDKLDRLLKKLSEVKTDKPIFIKMPINLDLKDYDGLLQICVKYIITGVIIGNLTKIKDPNLIKDEIPEHIKGGISGLPTQKLSDNLISYTFKNYGDKLKIMGVGGIFSADDAYEKIKRGASLLQLITGMIFEGPSLIKTINNELTAMLKNDGYKSISEAVGAYHI